MINGLKPVRVKRVSDQVFEQLRDLIFRGELKPGEKIMPERDLSEALGVSRTTVRNAINKLVTLGYLAHKQGRGTFVRSSAGLGSNPFSLVLGDPEITIGHILDVRMGLECNAAAGAARNADSEDIAIITSHLKDMKIEVRQGGLGTEADVSFHMAVAYATKNPLQVLIMKNFYDVLFTGIHTSLARLYEDPKNIDAILTQHTAIALAIEHRQPATAETAMKGHIGFVIDFFKSLPDA
jgi:GntR family transcriptional repressor for pyruvate dehydrogenase complex